MLFIGGLFLLLMPGALPLDAWLLLTAGGAGALHGATLARELHMRKVIVPRAPGQFSAWGMLMTNLRHDFIRTRLMPCDPSQISQITAAFSELEAEAQQQFRDEEFPLERVWMERFLDLRYRGQEHTVRTPVPAAALQDADQFDLLIEEFHELHEQAYSFRQDDPVEIVNFHVVGWGKEDKPSFAPLSNDGRSLDRAFKGERPVDFEDVGNVPSRVYERGLLPAGIEIDGPAVVEEPACTTIVYPQQKMMVDRFGNLVITEVAK